MLVTQIIPDKSSRAIDVNEAIQGPVLIVLWLFLSFAAAFRWFGTGADYLEYLTYYNGIPVTLSFLDTRFEPGFHLVAWFFRVVLDVGYDTFLLAVVALALGIKFYLMRRYLASPILAAVTYILMIYVLHEYTQIRAALSISLGLVAIHIWLGKRYVMAIVGVVAAFLVHSSVIILFPAFLFAQFLHWNWKGLVLIVALIASAILVSAANLSIVSLFSGYNPLISLYIQNTNFQEETSVLSRTNLLYAAMLIAAYYARWWVDDYRRSFLIISTLSIFALAVFSASPTVALRTREVLYGVIIFAAYRNPMQERDVPAIILLALNALVLGGITVSNGLIFGQTL